MTKIKNRFKIFKRYEEDFWGELYFSRIKSKVTKRVYGAASAHLTRINPKYLDITRPLPFRKKRLFKNLRGKANIMLKRFLIYFINLNKKILLRLFKGIKLSKISFKKSFALWIESRLDAFLFRINLFFSKLQIKNWIKDKKVLVNFIKVYSSDFNLKVGDIVSFEKKDKNYLIKKFKYYYLNFFNKEKRFKDFKIFRKKVVKHSVKTIKKKLNIYFNELYFNNWLKYDALKYWYHKKKKGFKSVYNIYKYIYILSKRLKVKKKIFI